jgi:hypothetical protein
MTGRPARTLILLHILALLLVAARGAAAQQVERQETAVRITAVDTADFPTVRVRVLASGSGGAPVGDLSRLMLRENGVPIPDATTARVPVGIDLVLVLDANADFLQFDDRSGLNRRDKVAQSAGRWAEQFMDPAGLDRVSVIVPDESGEGAAFLVEDVTRPGELAEAVAAYAPTPRATPLQPMLAAAIDHLAARREDGRFQAVLLYSDAARLNRQLDYPALTGSALAAGIPLYVAILGVEASPEEVANAAGLYRPTNGQYVHMPAPEATDPLFALFQAQGQQAQMAYRSETRENGDHEVSVSLGNVRDAASFTLALAAPEVAIDLPSATIRRAGIAADTPLPLLQPAVLPLTARIAWPDNRPRRLTEVVFRVDGVTQPLGQAPALDAAGQLPLAWDISERDAGTYRLEVEVVDELGFRAAAEPVDVAIEVSRPTPPTPTPAPTRAAPLPALSALGRMGEWPPWVWLVPIAAAGVLVWLWRAARRRAGRAAPPAEPPPPPAAADPADRHAPVLVWELPGGGSERVELPATDVTIGREPGEVDIVLDDPSVSRLHARVRRTAEDEYWLYDEGSILGTFLNHERLGLAPRRVQHGDAIQIGRLTLYFRLELARPAEPAEPDDSPASPRPDDVDVDKE